MEFNPHAEWVEWLDHVSSSDGTWQTLEDFKALEPQVIKSLGFVVKETESYIILVNHIESEDQVGDGFLILKSCIVSRTTID